MTARWQLTVILLIAAATFASTLSHPFLAWDDPAHLLDNPLVAAPLGDGWHGLLLTPHVGYPIPAVVLGWALERGLFGLTPTVFHGVNVAMHLGNVALVFLIARRLDERPLTAPVAALVFALHPLCAEPVSWVTGRKDLQATLCLLAGAYVLLGERPRYLAATVLGVLAMAAKPTAAVAPVLYFLLAQRRDGRAAAARLAPLGGLAVLAIVAGIIGHARVGAMPARPAATVVSDVVGAWAMNARHVIAPYPLFASYYPSGGEPSVIAYVLGALAIVVILVAVRRTGVRSTVGVGIVWALVAYAPIGALLPNRRWLADSYLYLPLVGVALAVASALASRPPRVVAIAAIAYALVAAPLAFVQSRAWASNATLWEPVVEHWPDEPATHTLYGLGLQNDGRLDEAAKVYAYIAQRWPERPGLESNQAWAFRRMGITARVEERLGRGILRGDGECATMYLTLVGTGELSPRQELIDKARALVHPSR